MSLVLVFAALVCAFIALLLSLGAHLFGWTWDQWIAGALVAYFLSLLWPWVDARRAPHA